MIYIGTHYEYPFGGMRTRPEWMPKGKADWDRDLDQICNTGINSLRIRIGFDSDLDEVEQFMDLIHAKGLKIQFAFATFYTPDWFVEKYPDSKIRNHAGDVVPKDKYDLRWQRSCIDHAVYREMRNQLIKDCVERFGNHPSIVAWCVHNEASAGPIDNPCFCDNTLRKYRQSLEVKYGLIDEVNAAFGCEFKRFDEVIPPSAYGTTPEDHAFWLDWKDFMSQNLNAFLVEGRDIISKYLPDMLVTHNAVNPYGIAYNSYDYWTMREYSLASMSFYFPSNAYSVANQSVLEMLKSLDPDKELWVTEFQGGSFPIVNPIYTRKDIELQLNSMFSHGVKGVFFYRWDPLLSGAEPMINGMTEPDTYDTESRLGLQETITNLSPFMDLINKGKSRKPRIGIYVQREQLMTGKQIDLLSGSHAGWYALLSDLGYEAGFIMDPFHADCGFDMVVLPDTRSMNKDWLEVENFARNGGRVVVELSSEEPDIAKQVSRQIGLEVTSHPKLTYLLFTGWDLRGTGVSYGGAEDQFNGYALNDRISFSESDDAILRYGDNHLSAAVFPDEYENRMMVLGFHLGHSYNSTLHFGVREFMGRYLAEFLEPDIEITGLPRELRPLIEARVLECGDNKSLLFVMNRSTESFDLKVKVMGYASFACQIEAYSVTRRVLS